MTPKEDQQPMTTREELHPYCQKCGWRKGGRDSWDGLKCKCGEYAPPIKRVDAEIVPLTEYHITKRTTEG